MKNCLWTKTLLTVYRYLERIAGAIDKIILQSGLNSGFVSGQNYYSNNVYAISQKIIDLSERKVTLINLKVLIEDVLKDIDENDAQILIEKFFDGVKTKDLVNAHGVSMRTMFRRIDGALKSFSSCLAMKGYSDATLSNMLNNEGWIKNVFMRFSDKNDEDLVLSNIFLEKAVSM